MLKSMQETLEHAFEVINHVYFEDLLPFPVITIMSSPRTNGHFTQNETWSVEDGFHHEINISAEHLDRPIENICATLCHECVHYYCLLNGISDISQYGRYHNKRFKEEAEKRGLIISHYKGIGWSVTTPSKEFTEVMRANGIVKPLLINRDGNRFISVGTGGGEGGDKDPGKKGRVQPVKPKCSTRKYICPSCGNSVRATKEVYILCGDCMIPFELAAKRQVD